MTEPEIKAILSTEIQTANRCTRLSMGAKEMRVHVG